jgi:TolB protein
MPASGGQAKQITRNPAQDFYPSWSPDGNSLAFSSIRGGNIDLYAIAVDGSGEKRLTNDPAPDYAPVISPDGAWIAFYSFRGGSYVVWRMPREGGEPLRLAPSGGEPYPIWSRDGRAVYFLDRNDLWMVPPEGGDARKLTDLSGKRGSMALDLATDGQYLYFTWREDAGDIWVMDVVYE